MKKNDIPIIVEQSFNASIQAVWNAITDINEMHKWYFENIPDFKPVVGFKTQFNVQSEERNFLHKWEITEVKPLRLIKYSWVFEEYPGKSTAAFEIFEEEKLTKLRLKVNVLEDFPDEIPEFTTDSCLNGWNYFIKQRLKDYLENKSE